MNIEKNHVFREKVKYVNIDSAKCKVEEQGNIGRAVLIFEFNYCEYLSAPRRDLKYRNKIRTCECISLTTEDVYMNILPEFDTESGFLRNLRSV